MVSRRCRPVQLLVTHRLMYSRRLPLLHILSRCQNHSSMLQRVRKKQRKNLVKKMNSAQEGQNAVKEVETKKLEEKTTSVENEMKPNEVLQDLPGIPALSLNRSTKAGIIFVFEKASLAPAYVGKSYAILNPDDHANFIRKNKKDPYRYRPEIAHQVLLEVMDSKLYKSGRVQGIYVKTDEGVLIKIEPHTQIPETFGKFCAMMLQVLHKFSIKAKGGKPEKLLRVIANPVTQHLPTNCRRIGLSFSSNKVVRLKEYVEASSDDVNLVFVVGAMAHGKIDCDYIDDFISVSEFPLSAASCVRRICCAVEKKWKIL